MKKLLVLLLLMMFTSANTNADPVFHKFQVWGTLSTQTRKMDFYVGWTNGYLTALASNGLPKEIAFSECLNTLSYEQAVAMIDKYYNNHPERWNNLIGSEMVEALTVKGGPCEGKFPSEGK